MSQRMIRSMGTAMLVGLLAACNSSTMNPPGPGGPDGGSPTGDLGSMDAGSDAHAPMLSLIAGGLGGPGAFDGTGAMARFSEPRGSASDGAGNLYVTDSKNNLIRKVVLATGVVTTIAGTAGLIGSADGIGKAARFDYPQAVALDGSGNLYVADTFNHTIRKVVLATGVVSTVAGTAGMPGSTDGTGSAARFNGPRGLAVDGAGNLFVGDTGNNTIREMVLATGVVTTLAGAAGMSGSTDATGPAARFSIPRGITYRAGNLFVADSGNHTIREIVVATAVVTTLAGTAGMSGSTDGTGTAARFNSPFDVTSDTAGDVYVADELNDTVRKIVVTSQVVTTIAGSAGTPESSDGTGAMARFYEPQGISYDAAGDLYISDTSNNSIRKMVLGSGAVTTIAGHAGGTGDADGTGAAARFDSPDGVASDQAGNLYVADTNSSTIRKVVPSTGVVTTLAGAPGMVGSTDGTGSAARFNKPRAVAADGSGNLYVADTENDTIRKVVIATGVVTTIAGTAGMAGADNGTGTVARFDDPSGLATDGAGNLYVADTDNSTIRAVVLASGAVSTLAGTAQMDGSADGTGSAARFYDPVGLAVDKMGNLYVADYENQEIRKIVLSSATVTTLAGASASDGSTDGAGNLARFHYPAGLATDGQGNLYVADTDNSTIREIVLATGQVSTVVGVAGQQGVRLGALPASLGTPEGVAVLPNGELIILDAGESSILTVE